MDTYCKRILIFFFFSLFFTYLKAQDFTYQAKNPYFGGNTFNYQWMLNSAQAQDNIKNPDNDRSDRSNASDENSLDRFTESLNRQILNDLSRNLFETDFGEDGLEEGTYTIGDFQIDVIPSQDGLAITIIDILSGGQTQIVVPYY